MDVFHKDNNKTEDKYLAAYICYLYGKDALVRCESVGKDCTYTLRCPDEDFKICIAEAADENTSIFLKPFQDLLGFVVSKMLLSRKAGAWQQRKN